MKIWNKSIQSFDDYFEDIVWEYTHVHVNTTSSVGTWELTSLDTYVIYAFKFYPDLKA